MEIASPRPLAVGFEAATPPQRDGTVVLKLTFGLDDRGRCQLAPEQDALRTDPVEARDGSVAYPPDIGGTRSNCDVLLVGNVAMLGGSVSLNVGQRGWRSASARGLGPLARATDRGWAPFPQRIPFPQVPLLVTVVSAAPTFECRVTGPEPVVLCMREGMGPVRVPLLIERVAVDIDRWRVMITYRGPFNQPEGRWMLVVDPAFTESSFAMAPTWPRSLGTNLSLGAAVSARAPGGTVLSPKPKPGFGDLSRETTAVGAPPPGRETSAAPLPFGAAPKSALPFRRAPMETVPDLGAPSRSNDGLPFSTREPPRRVEASTPAEVRTKTAPPVSGMAGTEVMVPVAQPLPAFVPAIPPAPAPDPTPVPDEVATKDAAGDAAVSEPEPAVEDDLATLPPPAPDTAADVDAHDTDRPMELPEDLVEVGTIPPTALPEDLVEVGTIPPAALPEDLVEVGTIPPTEAVEGVARIETMPPTEVPEVRVAVGTMPPPPAVSADTLRETLVHVAPKEVQIEAAPISGARRGTEPPPPLFDPRATMPSVVNTASVGLPFAPAPRARAGDPVAASAAPLNVPAATPFVSPPPQVAPAIPPPPPAVAPATVAGTPFLPKGAQQPSYLRDQAMIAAEAAGKAPRGLGAPEIIEQKNPDDLRIEGLTIGEFSALRDRLDASSADRRGVLKAHGLTELRWRVVERRWAKHLVELEDKPAALVEQISAMRRHRKAKRAENR